MSEYVYDSAEWRVAFAEHECECDHPAGVHDDGFGCTETDCMCLAGWQIEQEG